MEEATDVGATGFRVVRNQNRATTIHPITTSLPIKGKSVATQIRCCIARVFNDREQTLTRTASISTESGIILKRVAVFKNPLRPSYVARKIGYLAVVQCPNIVYVDKNRSCLFVYMLAQHLAVQLIPSKFATMTTLLHADLTYYLRGVGFKIQNALGSGHREADYENALAYQFEQDGVVFRQQPIYTVSYREKQIGAYRPDFTLAANAFQLDLKATPAITVLHKAQVLSYLAVTGAELVFIMNFGAASMYYERLPNFLATRQVIPRIQSPLNAPPKHLLYAELTTPILEALHTVHITLGPGFLHQVYRRATRIELSQIGLNFEYLKELPLRFNGQAIGKQETRLFWVEQKLLLATVALIEVTPAHISKLRWAMGELDCQLGLLANFYGTQVKVQFVRIK